MAARRQHCFWCGEDLGEYDSFGGEPEACGKSECQRELVAELRGAREEREERARADDWERY